MAQGFKRSSLKAAYVRSVRGRGQGTIPRAEVALASVGELAIALRKETAKAVREGSRDYVTEYLADVDFAAAVHESVAVVGGKTTRAWLESHGLKIGAKRFAVWLTDGGEGRDSTGESEAHPSSEQDAIPEAPVVEPGPEKRLTSNGGVEAQNEVKQRCSEEDTAKPRLVIRRLNK
jgi:hypothetical protein